MKRTDTVVSVTGNGRVPDISFAISCVPGEVLMQWRVRGQVRLTARRVTSSSRLLYRTADNQSMHAGAFSVFLFCFQSLNFDFILTIYARMRSVCHLLCDIVLLLLYIVYCYYRFLLLLVLVICFTSSSTTIVARGQRLFYSPLKVNGES